MPLIHEFKIWIQADKHEDASALTEACRKEYENEEEATILEVEYLDCYEG